MRSSTPILIAQTLGLLWLATVSGAAAQDDVPPYTLSRTEVRTVADPQSDRVYDLYIRVPLGYDADREDGYPVIYLNDGPYTFLVAAGAAHLPMNARVVERSILVGLSFANGENGMDSRVRDLTPSVDPGWDRRTGGAPAYLEFFRSQVIPTIERAYNADPARRILSGQSLGGSFGAWVLLTEPELFSGYILTSPSLWYDDHMIFELETAFAEAHDDLPAQVYVATGALETPGRSTRHDLAGDQERFAERLASRDYPSLRLRSEIIDGGRHETTFPQGFVRGLDWMLGP